MDTTALQDLLAALSVWSGRGLVTWAGDALWVAQATLDTEFNSTAVIATHASVASALAQWGIAASVALLSAIYFLPRLLADR